MNIYIMTYKGFNLYKTIYYDFPPRIRYHVSRVEEPLIKYPIRIKKLTDNPFNGFKTIVEDIDFTDEEYRVAIDKMVEYSEMDSKKK